MTLWAVPGVSGISVFAAYGVLQLVDQLDAPGRGRAGQSQKGLERLEERFQIEAVNSPSGVTHVTLSPVVTAASRAGQEAGRRPAPFSTS
jgi:hypothetical protein